MGVYLLKPGTFQITTVGTNSSPLSAMGGSSEPFLKTFHSAIIVEDQGKEISKFLNTIELQKELIVSGSFLINNHLTINTTGTTVLSVADLESIILIDTTSGTVTLQLPTTTLATKGRIYFIKKIGGTNSLTINPASTTTIDGALTRATTDASASIQLMSSGVAANGYYILSEYGTWT